MSDWPMVASRRWRAGSQEMTEEVLLSEPKCLGADRWGSYYDLTGFEYPSRCFWCGAEVDGRRRYCCEEHQKLYLESFHWPEASLACRERSPSCAGCGQHFRGLRDGEVHHIIPLNGSQRLWNVLNRQENLARLCPTCHAPRPSSARIR